MNRDALLEAIHQHVPSIPNVKEAKFVRCCNGDVEGCGGLLVVRVNRNLTSAEYCDTMIGIQSWMPEALDDGALPHQLIVEPEDPFDVWDDPDFEDAVYIVKKED